MPTRKMPTDSCLIGEPMKPSHDIHLPATISHYPKGQLPLTYTPGDIGLVSDPKTPDALSSLIQARERAIYGHTSWANLIHSFGILDEEGNIAEAQQPGVQKNHITDYLNQDVYILHPKATKSQRNLCVARWASCVGMEYDVLGFIGLGLQTLVGWHVLLDDSHGLICSALCCYGALAYVERFSLPYQAMTPADIAHDFAFPIDEAPVPLNLFARFLDGLVTVAKAIF